MRTAVAGAFGDDDPPDPFVLAGQPYLVRLTTRTGGSVTFANLRRVNTFRGAHFSIPTNTGWNNNVIFS